MKFRWRFGLVAAIFLAIFCLYPQLKMFYLRGSEWNGHYAYNDIDEVAYASYVRALIDGRPRKNDPYSGRDESPQTPQPESLFSIQFAAPYTIAIPARLLGIGTPWAMILSGALAGFFTAFAAFWLIARMTGSNWYGMAGALAVLAGGALAAGEGAAPEVFLDGFSYPYFPGFRRYIPALAMVAVFGLFAAVWKLLGNAERGMPNAEFVPADSDTGDAVREARQDKPPSFVFRIPYSASILLAILCFAYTVFSYFFIWTTAAAWLGCVFLVWLVFRPVGFWEDLKSLFIVGAGCVASLIPYAWLLSRRSETMDDVQLLVYTRAPDLWRVPELISIVCVLMLAVGSAKKWIQFRDRSTLFALSLALVPLAVFNQQIVTGHSLQPIHYQVFIGNYVAALALILTVGVLLREKLSSSGPLPKFACAGLTVVAIAWGFTECHYTVRVLDEANVDRDAALPVAKRLEVLSRDDVDPHRSTVLSYDMIQADDMPSVAPQNVLWSRHQHVFAGMSWQENKDRYFQFLYYLNVDAKGLDYLLKNDFVSKIALFGWGRHSDRLSSEARPLTYGEIAIEVNRYAAYRANFDAASAASPMLSYAVVNNEVRPDLTNLDKWYNRDAGEVIGKYTLYKLELRAR
ncbi:MAG TPA: hypothetical protein VMZ26_00620 [Pyrinomonadaceae bacterium]|nr:hypothetical protein [Pyrinomonadaceae bacterium]